MKKIPVREWLLLQIPKINNFDFKTALTYAFITFLVLRVFTSLVLLIGNIHPPPVQPYSENVNIKLISIENKSEFSKFFLAPWYRWDTVHYLELAEFGYDYDYINSVWPPIFPLLIKITDIFIGFPLLSSLLVSGLFSIIGFALLFFIVKELFDYTTAGYTLFFLAIFPSSFYFVAGYSELIFLTFSLAVILLSIRKQWIYAGIFAALATLTRVQGILLIVPIFVDLVQDYRTQRNTKDFLKGSITLLYAPIAYGLFSLYVYFGLQI